MTVTCKCDYSHDYINILSTVLCVLVFTSYNCL